MDLIYTVYNYLICLVPFLVFLAFTPQLTRKSESFGVSIPEDRYEDPAVKRIRDVYRKQTLLYGGLITALSFGIDALFKNDISFITFPVSLILLLGVSSIFYLKGHKRMKSLKAERKWTETRPQVAMADTKFRQKRILCSPWWFLSYGLLIGVTLALEFIFYDIIPEQIPLNFNLQGEPVRWITKSYKAMFFGPVMQLLMAGLMVFVYWIIGKAKQQIDPSDPEQSLIKNQIFRYRWSVYIVFSGLMLIILFGLMPFIGLIKIGWIVAALPLGISGLVVIWAIVLSFTTGQGGSRISIGKTKTGEPINRDDDRYWKLGVFYYNPDDPALFVEKRFGIGWTSNFARPMSWILIIGFIAVIIIIIAITNSLTK